MTKKIISILLCVSMLFGFTVTVFADDESTSLPYEDSQYFTEGDYSIHYRVIEAEGDMQGRILFIHGFLFSGATWYSMATTLAAEGYECVLVDLPNFGYSTRETSDTELISREQLMVDLMESIAPLSEWIVAGHSMGGGIAANIAAQYPEIQALLLYAPAAQDDSFSWMSKIADSSFLMSVFDCVASMLLHMKLVVKLAFGYAASDLSYGFSCDISEFTTPLLISGTMEGMLRMYANAQETDLDAISELEMPVLLVWATNDKVLSSSAISEFNSALSGVAETYYVDGGHIFIESEADTAASITLSFLNAQ